MSKDSLGDRMKDIEYRTRYMLPRRTYTIIRLDGKSFHTFLKHAKKPFDRGVMDCMQNTTLELCKQIMGCRIGYTQSDEITLILTDFSERTTEAWFDGNLQKICSISAAIATAEFNRQWTTKELLEQSNNPGLRKEEIIEVMSSLKLAQFDARVYTTSDPWEALNACTWRQNDASKNSVQMVAQSLFHHKELQNKNFSQLNEMIHSKGQNWNDYPTDCKRGAFVIRVNKGTPKEGEVQHTEWIIDKDGPELTKDRKYFFNQVPLISQPDLEKM